VRIILTAILAALLLVGCSIEANYAPVRDVSGIERIPKNGMHRVVAGESFYAIAWRYGLDYRSLAKRNGLTRPYYIYVGEMLSLRRNNPRAQYHSAPRQNLAVSRIYPSPPKPLLTESTTEPEGTIRDWHWPARGFVIGSFSAFNKGINIAGERGEPVYAAAAGKVVYSGKGLRSYGNLIIIKHNSDYLTAYAHNSKNLVREGDWVGVGQEIAKMGSTGASRVILHFEIRREGEPVNPLSYLVSR
jgi:lipoprotein NlpD